MNRSIWRLVLIVVGAAIAGALVTLAIVHKPEKDEEDGEAVVTSTAARVTVVDGEPTIELDPKTQQTIGLATVPVAASHQTQQLQLYGTVVDVQELTAIHNQVASARAQLQESEAKASFDRTELSRLRSLNADNKAVSDKAVQEAAAGVAADEAAAASARASLRAAGDNAVQRFGAVIANAMSSGSPLYNDLASLRSVLIQLAIPGGAAPPPTITITSGGTDVTARLLSAAPRADPRLQGASYFYVATGAALSSGMNVVAHHATATAVEGTVIPPAAIVSWQGKSWVYVRRDPTHFSRREITGAFATNVPSGTEVVTTGAQQLLSQEMRAQLGED